MYVSNAEESFYLPPKVIVVQKALLQAMRTTCCLSAEHSRNQHLTHELQDGGELGERADLLLCYHYYVRRQKEFQNNDHDVFNAKYMDAFCNFVEYIPKRERH